MPSTRGVGSRGQTNFECCHVAYQIKWKEVETNIEAKTLTLQISRPFGCVERSDIDVVYIRIFLLNYR